MLLPTVCFEFALGINSKSFRKISVSKEQIGFQISMQRIQVAYGKTQVGKVALVLSKC